MGNNVIDRLLKSEEPSIRFKVRVGVLNENPNSPSMLSLQKEIKSSKRVQRLLTGINENGSIEPVSNPYRKWFGVHWILVHLAELCYPKGDSMLFPLREQVYNAWLPENIHSLYECRSRSAVYKGKGVAVLDGKARICASTQGNALFSTLALGIANDRAKALGSLLLKWQWPDGGWNCDKNPGAKISSFHETLIPLRALSLYSQTESDSEIKNRVKKASEVFLSRNMFRRKRDGEIIKEAFMQLHYPSYWHYDILFGLKVMAECGFINDPRCTEALEILENKQLPEGGWACEGKYYKVSEGMDYNQKQNYDKVAWGIVSKRHMNEWVTADALFILSKAGRLQV